MAAQLIANKLVPKSEPTKEDKKRVSIDVNEDFHVKLYNQARLDRTTVSEITRRFWEQYLSGHLKVVSQ